MNKFSTYLQYNWYKFLFIILVPLFFWLIIYSDIDQVKYDEGIRILYVGDNLNAEELQKNIKENIVSTTTQELKNVFIITCLEDKEISYEYLRNRIFSVDIVILEDDFYDESKISQIFVPLTQKLQQEINSSDYIMISNNPYGIKIPDNSIFNEFYYGDSDTFIFLSQYSLNAKKAYGYGKTENDSAIAIIKYLIE